MRHSYSPAAFAELLAAVASRPGWDFSRVYAVRGRVPWDYEDVVARYLRPADEVLDIGTGGGEVGERNMARVRHALAQPPGPPVLRQADLTASGLTVLAFAEYDVEYVVTDIESLVFWLRALDPAHADLDGGAALASADTLNRVLAGNVDERGFVTSEHRYLAVARLPWPC